MDGELERIRELAGKRRRRNERLPKELAMLLTEYVRRERARGDLTWEEMAAATGVSANTLARLGADRSGESKEKKLVAIRVGADRAVRKSSAVVVVTPTGYRVEGLGVAEAAELVRIVG